MKQFCCGRIKCWDSRFTRNYCRRRYKCTKCKENFTTIELRMNKRSTDLMGQVKKQLIELQTLLDRFADGN